jgi:hypothetical protein
MERNQISNWKQDWESIALPVILMLTGLVLIGGSGLGVVSLDRIQNLWPVALILIGLTELVPSGNSARS